MSYISYVHGHSKSNVLKKDILTFLVQYRHLHVLVSNGHSF